MNPRIVEVRKNIMKKNDLSAAAGTSGDREETRGAARNAAAANASVGADLGAVIKLKS